MSKLTKKQKIISENLDTTKTYSISEAMELIKSVKSEKFEESVDISIRLGVDPNKSDQNVRGAVTLPNSLGKQVTVATVTCFPRLFGRVTAPRTFWSDLFGSTPSLIDISTDSSNFSDLTDLISSIASEIEYVLVVSKFSEIIFCFLVNLLTALHLLPCF